MPLIVKSKALLIMVIILCSALPVETSFAGNVKYVYDEHDRLKEAQYDDGTNIVYQYDKTGNLTAKYTVGVPMLYLSADRRSVTLTPVNGSSVDAYKYILSNIGQGDLVFGTATITGDNPADFTITNDTCSSRSIPPSANCTIAVAFTPKSAGQKNAVITIPSNATNGNMSSATDFLTGLGYIPTISVSKQGEGTGTVTIDPGGLSCGSVCSGTFMTGTSITLTAVPDTNYIFGGWAGITGCDNSGTTCTVALNQDTTVRAIFMTPVADYAIRVYPYLGAAPLTVDFLGIINNAPNVSWNWDFGDGTSSSSKSTTHVYNNPGSYQVWFSIYNPDGSLRIAGGTSVSVSPSFIRVLRFLPIYTHKLQDAYNAAINGDTIQMGNTYFSENLTIDKSIVLDGGYDYGFSTKSGATTLYGNLIVNYGSVTIQDLIIQ